MAEWTQTHTPVQDLRDALKATVRSMLPRRAVQWLVRHRARPGMAGLDAKGEERLFKEICGSIDVERLRNLRSDARHELKCDPNVAAKYYDHETWLRRSIREAARLGLHHSRGLKVLDLGCGPGWFLAVCRHLGHEATGLDLPFSMMRPADQAVYLAIPEILGCTDSIRHAPVMPFDPLQAEGVYDLVASFLVCFDGRWEGRPWGVEEWRFFLADANRILSKDGRLFLELNEKALFTPGLVYYDQASLDLFLSVGNVNGCRILVSKSHLEDELATADTRKHEEALARAA